MKEISIRQREVNLLNYYITSKQMKRQEFNHLRRKSDILSFLLLCLKLWEGTCSDTCPADPAWM
jgi:hypothetical protein